MGKRGGNDDNYTEDEKYELLRKIEDGVPKSDKFSDSELAILEEFSKDKDSCIRSEVARLLVNSTENRGERILIRLTEDKDALVRTEACDSLSSSYSEETFDLLMRRAKSDDNGMVRGYAVFSLGDLAFKLDLVEKATEFLEEQIVKERVVFPKISIYQVLYSLGKKEHIHSLVAGLNARVYQNRCATVHCLEDILDVDNFRLIRQALEDRKKKDREGICRYVEH